MIWLPRLLDKARAFQAGTLGTYAYPSALDQSFMRRLGLTPSLVERQIRTGGSDEEIASAIRKHVNLSDDELGARCEAFRQKNRLAFWVLDRDDGYLPGIGYPIPKFLQPPLWRWYQRWSAKKASATSL
mgnify:FL=1